MYDFTYLRRYGTQTDVTFTLRVRSATNVLPPDPVAGAGIAAAEVQISKDFGAFANTTNLPVSLGLGLYRLTITATEMQATWIDIMITDGGGAWIPVHLSLETKLELRSLLVSNDNGDAVTFVSTGANGKGLVATGIGTGHGIHATGGATGDGVRGTGGATTGNGINGVAPTSGSGVAGTGGGGGSGILGQGGATGHGLSTTGGATSGDGIRSTGGTNGHGLNASGTGAGAGLYAFAGATGAGALFTGGATSGSAIYAVAPFNGHGLLLQAAGANNGGLKAIASAYHAVHFQSQAGNFHGLFCEASGAGNGNGIQASGKGTGHGFQATGGVTGHGFLGTGGATSGSGALFAATAGNSAGLKVTGVGNGDAAFEVITTGSIGARFSNAVGSVVELANATNNAGASFLGTSSGALFNGGTADGAIFSGARGATFQSIGGGAGDAALKIVAGGSSFGLRIQGRPNIAAASIEGASSGTGSHGLVVSTAAGNSYGVLINGFGTLSGLSILGGASAAGVNFQGGATSGPGLFIAGVAGNSDGLTIQGFGTGQGVNITSGLSGNGVQIRGGNTVGSGVDIRANNLGHGIRVQGAGASQHGIYAKAGSTNAHGIFAEGGTASGNGFNGTALAGNSDGGVFLGQGTGHGLRGNPDIFPTFSADELTGGDPVGVLADNPSFRELWKWMGVYFFNDATQTNTTRTFRNNANNATLGVQAVGFNSGTGLQTQGKLS